MQKKITVILGHTYNKGFCASLFEEYIKSAKTAGHEVKTIKLGELDFDPILHKGYHEIQELEPDLVDAQEKIKWAEHLVFIFPNWWASFPAILKGFIDRAFLPGFAFKYHKNDPLWDKLLKGRSARLIVTMDSPSLFYKIFLCSAGVKTIKTGVLKFCGISPVKITYVDRVKNLSTDQKNKWFKKVEKLGKMGK